VLEKLGFRHGVHPPERKELTSGLPIRRMPFPGEVVLPLRQHAGKPAVLVVKKGDHVERGDPVGTADGWMSVPIHSSAAGTVTGVEWWPHIDGTMALSVRIAVDRYALQLPRPRLVPHWEGLATTEVVKAVQEAGVVGLGGAAFPTGIKWEGAAKAQGQPKYVVCNADESEPGTFKDRILMEEDPHRTLEGMIIAAGPSVPACQVPSVSATAPFSS